MSPCRIYPSRIGKKVVPKYTPLQPSSSMQFLNIYMNHPMIGLHGITSFSIQIYLCIRKLWLLKNDRHGQNLLIDNGTINLSFCGSSSQDNYSSRRDCLHKVRPASSRSNQKGHSNFLEFVVWVIQTFKLQIHKSRQCNPLRFSVCSHITKSNS